MHSTPLSWVRKMQRSSSSSSRKRTGSSSSSCSMKNPNKNKKKNVGGLKKSIVKPLDPTYLRPTLEECRLVRDTLMDFHGFPEEFLKYRHRRNHPDSVSGSSSSSSSQKLIISSGSGLLNSNLLNEVVKLESFLDGDGDGFCCGDSTSLNEEEEEEETQKESVLDGLVSTLLSQNTTEVNSRKAFLSLKSTFPTWEDVLAADLKCIENAIKCGGLAVTKAACINNLLTGLLERKGKLCLEHLRDMAVDDIKAELSGFKGIGPKTVACVLMFHLQIDDFPVDTHVFRITKAMGWVPSSSDREKAYLHLNERIPNELKFDLNCLLVTHGKLCQRCKSGEEQRKTSLDQSCPLSNYCSTSVEQK